MGLLWFRVVEVVEVVEVRLRNRPVIRVGSKGIAVKIRQDRNKT